MDDERTHKFSKYSMNSIFSSYQYKSMYCGPFAKFHLPKSVSMQIFFVFSRILPYILLNKQHDFARYIMFFITSNLAHILFAHSNSFIRAMNVCDVRKIEKIIRENTICILQLFINKLSEYEFIFNGTRTVNFSNFGFDWHDFLHRFCFFKFFCADEWFGWILQWEQWIDILTIMNGKKELFVLNFIFVLLQKKLAGRNRGASCCLN